LPENSEAEHWEFSGSKNKIDDLYQHGITASTRLIVFPAQCGS
jgi:hypothetical protein